ncbi:MAG TPA: hypothetical protein VFC41_08970, partial [Anaerovoracaceae bacterium]|nr:hypothetical protein [Anaerovoracaceae bacterium]
MLKICDGYYQDNLVNYECESCGMSFIVGEELVKGCGTGLPVCPYCGCGYVVKRSWTDDERLEGMGLGCVGIYLEKEEPASPFKVMEDVDG